MLGLNKKYAFSVQEILIVVLLVGIAAAILLPAVINEIYDRHLRAKWRKEYSVISNVFNQIIEDDVEVCEFNDEGNCSGQSLSSAFLKKMTELLRKSDCYTGTIKEEFCPQYDFKVRARRAENVLWTAYGSITKYSSLGKRGSISVDEFNEMFVLLNDGAAIYFGTGEKGPWIVVDVNNFKGGPNELGRDLYILNIYSNKLTNEHKIMPAGAQNTPDYDNEKSGSSDCSKDIGLKTTSSVHNAAGAGCSYKYILH